MVNMGLPGRRAFWESCQHELPETRRSVGELRGGGFSDAAAAVDGAVTGCGTGAGSVLESVLRRRAPTGKGEPLAEVPFWDRAACHLLPAAKSGSSSRPPLHLGRITGRQQDRDLGNFAGRLQAGGGRESGLANRRAVPPTNSPFFSSPVP